MKTYSQKLSANVPAYFTGGKYFVIIDAGNRVDVDFIREDSTISSAVNVGVNYNANFDEDFSLVRITSKRNTFIFVGIHSQLNVSNVSHDNNMPVFSNSQEFISQFASPSFSFLDYTIIDDPKNGYILHNVSFMDVNSQDTLPRQENIYIESVDEPSQSDTTILYSQNPNITGNPSLIGQRQITHDFPIKIFGHKLKFTVSRQPGGTEDLSNISYWIKAKVTWL